MPHKVKAHNLHAKLAFLNTELPLKGCCRNVDVFVHPLALMSRLPPLFTYDIFGYFGHERTRKWASACHGEVPLVCIHVFVPFIVVALLFSLSYSIGSRNYPGPPACPVAW